MALRQTVDQLVSELTSIDNTPINQQTFSNDTLIQFMNAEMQITIVPLVISAREEYFVIVQPIIVDQNTVRVDIPADAAGFRLRDVYLYNPQVPSNFVGKAKRINPDVIPYYSGTGLISPVMSSGMLPQYIIENNSLIFIPALNQSYLLKLRYLKMPNQLASYVKCGGQVLTKNGGNSVTVDNVPQGQNILPNGSGDWTQFTGVNATTLDVLQPNMPFNFRFMNTTNNTDYPLINRQIVGVSGASVTLDADTYSAVQPGDFLVTSGYSPFVQFLPFEAYELIKMRASMRILKAQGDLINWGVSGQLYNAMQADFLNIITPKVENSPKKIGGGGARGTLLGNAGYYRGTF